MSGPREHLINSLIHEGLPRNAVLDAIRYTPRDQFVPERAREQAWDNRPLGIGAGQTISQPYTVAVMLNLADLRTGHRVLEIGSGSGYVLALLAYLVGSGGQVTGVEREEELYSRTRARLEELNLRHVHLKKGDGRHGCPERGPYDAIVVSAQTPEIPEALFAQLAAGGRLVVPIDIGSYASMTCARREEDGSIRISRHGAFQFVPLR